MFHKSTFTVLALLAPLLANCADVTPTEPGGGETFTADQTCHVAWKGNTDPTTNWTQMSIELMSGDNFHMNHITTVASNLNGEIDGDFNYTCPELNPYSAIYFYQFSSPNAVDKQWTTRFTIASPTGTTTPPANAVQPDSNAPTPWGVGALVDPSKAVAPPPPSLPSPGAGAPPVPPPANPANSTSTSNTPAAPPTTPTNTPAAPNAPTTPNAPVPPATSVVVVTVPSAAPTDTSGSAAANNNTTDTGASGKSGNAMSVMINGHVYLGAAVAFISFSLLW